MKQEIQEIDVTKIVPSKWNPRKDFSGPNFDELIDSIREKGVIQPILVRPIADGMFETVFGERRFKALLQLAKDNGGPQGFTIPAIVKELTDDQAFDFMVIENLQREDLTELEEARSFKSYADRNGIEKLPDLAQRTGKKLAYIQRRLLIIRLPEKVLQAWEKGQLKYGHLEQLARSSDNKKILEFLQDILKWPHMWPIDVLKQRIDNAAPALKDARFDLEKIGCLECEQNSDIQKKLFGELGNVGKAHCLNPKCFKQNQNNWFTKNWSKTGYARNFGTNGFRFDEDMNYRDYEFFFDKPAEKCRECSDFVTIINTNGKAIQQKVCVGSSECFNEVTSSKKKSEDSSKEKNKAKPTSKPWHGQHFREQFYKEQIPLKIQEMKPDDQKIRQLLLASLLHSDSDLKGWFGKKYMGKKEEKWGGYGYVGNDEAWLFIQSMAPEQVEEILKESTIQILLQTGFGAKARYFVGTYLGFDLAKDWRITEEYLNAKTISEILEMGEKFDIFKDKKAQDYLYEKLNKKRGKFKSCKKTELKSIILESGVDLSGKVPKEILDVE